MRLSLQESIDQAWRFLSTQILQVCVDDDDWATVHWVEGEKNGAIMDASQEEKGGGEKFPKRVFCLYF